MEEVAETAWETEAEVDSAQEGGSGVDVELTVGMAMSGSVVVDSAAVDSAAA